MAALCCASAIDSQIIEPPVRVTVLEIGESRVGASWGLNRSSRFQSPLAVRLEAKSASAFEGRIETVLRTTNSPLWEPVDVWESSWVDVEISLDPNVSSTFELLFQPQRLLGEFREIAWKVLDRNGEVVADGFERTRRLESDEAASTWQLFLTDEHIDARRRSPAEAFRAAFEYAPYQMVAIESSDLAKLDERSRRALLDAIAFGRILVVSGSTEGLPESISDALAQERSRVWKGADGTELRETRMVFGTVRYFSGGLSQLVGLPDPVKKLVDTGGSITPRQFYFARAPVILWGEQVLPEEENKDYALVLWTCSLVLSVGLAFLVFLWVTARRSPPISGRTVGPVILAAVAFSVVAHHVLVANAVKNDTVDATVVWHDIHRSIHIRRVVMGIGNGGGSRPVDLRYQRDVSGLWFPMSTGTLWRTIVESPDVGVIKPFGIHQVIHQSLGLVGLFSEPIESGWVGTATWDHRGLSGSVRSLRNFDLAVLVGLGGTAGLGPVHAGQVIDLSEAEFASGVRGLNPKEIRLIAEEPEILDIYWWPHGPSIHPPFLTRRLTESEFLLIAREAAAPHVTHVQPIEITSISEPPLVHLEAWVPCEDLGPSYRIFVPDEIFSRWSTGTVVDCSPVSFEIGDELQFEKWNGFRVIEIEKIFRTSYNEGDQYLNLRWTIGGES